MLQRIGILRGICVILGDSTGSVTSRLAGDTELLLYVQLRSAEQVVQVRERMNRAGLLGRQVWVERGDGAHLHLADNIADVLVTPDGTTVLSKLVAFNGYNGTILWEHEHGNFQLVLRAEGLYCLSGNRDRQKSVVLDPLSGKLLTELQTAKRGCARPNGSIDSILYRALGGSTCLDTRQRKPMWISPMRAECNDGHKLPRWGTFKPSRPPQWRFDCKDSRAVAVTKNMVVVASKDRVIGLSLNDGKPLWSQPIPMPPVPWGIAVDRSGRVVVTLKDGQVICFGKGV